MKRERGTGSLRLRGAIYWLRYHHHGQLIEESSGTGDEKQARRELRRKLKPADTPDFVSPKARKVTVDDLADVIRRDYVRRGNRSRVEPRLTQLLRTFTGRRALTLSSEEIDAYLDARRAAGATVATANREAACLRRMFRLAVDKGILPRAPKITLRREDNVREGFLEPSDLDAFLAALRARDPAVADLAEMAS